MVELQPVIDATPEILAGAVEVTKSVVEVGDMLNIAKGTLQVVGSTADAITPFIPLIGAATTIINEIISIYQQAECNTRIVSALYDRTKLAEFAVDTLQRRKKIHEKDFRDQEWYNAFNRFVYVLKEIRNFAKEVASLRGVNKYLKSSGIKEKFESLSKEYDEVMKALNFTLAVANDEQRRYDNECLMEDIAEMGQFLQKIEGNVVTTDNKLNLVLEELRLLKISVDSGKGPVTKPKEIPESEIKDPYYNEETDYRGSNKHIMRRQYRTIDVACKPFELNEDNNEQYKKKQGQLAILSKLSESTNILKFYGLATLEGQGYMIMEWAHYGNLREVYERNDIPWMRKLHIATDICRAITFLQSVNIFHHDLRCENVMLTMSLEPKLTNFEHARSTKGTTSSIGDLMKIVHWLAPEKMLNKQTPYNAKCEIFSFGMLLWELTFEKIPYQGWDMDKVEHHVKSGKRERITFGPVADDRELEIQKVLEKVITEAWKHKPEERISLIRLFNTLEGLQSKYRNLMEQDCKINLLPQKSLDLDGTNSNPHAQDSDADVMEIPECEDFTLDFGISTAISFEEGVKAHKEGKYEKAWECFEYHADNGNASAKYWMAYYLWEGKHVEVDRETAAKLYKEAADKGIADAQLRYAFTLQKNLKKKKVRDEFIQYLTMAADNGNQAAQFNLGDVYFNKKLTLDDRQKGIHYLKLAALQNHPNAIKILENNNISFSEN